MGKARAPHAPVSHQERVGPPAGPAAPPLPKRTDNEEENMGTEQRRVAIITGGAQGIGKAIAKRLLASGLVVVIADRDAEAGRETEAELRAAGAIGFVHADVSREEDVGQVVEAALKRFGRLGATGPGPF